MSWADLQWYSGFWNNVLKNASHEISTPLSIIRSKIAMWFSQKYFGGAGCIPFRDSWPQLPDYPRLNTALLTLTKDWNISTLMRWNSFRSCIRNNSALMNWSGQKKLLLQRPMRMDTSAWMPITRDVHFRYLIGKFPQASFDEGFISISAQQNNSIFKIQDTIASSSEKWICDRFVTNNPYSESLGLGLRWWWFWWLLMNVGCFETDLQ